MQNNYAYAVMVVTAGGLLAAGVASAATFTTLHTFADSEASGDIELAVVNDQIDLVGYAITGSASSGGIGIGGGSGTLFNYSSNPNPDPGGTIQPYFNFASYVTYGQKPTNLVLQKVLSSNSQYVVYGATQFGDQRCGQSDGFCGAIFAYTTDSTVGSMATLHRFRGGADGTSAAALLIDSDGVLIGTSTSGGRVDNPLCDSTAPDGPVGCGFVFELAPGGHLKYRHVFSGGARGAEPTALTLRPNGELVGIAGGGLNANREIIYKLSPQGTYHVIYDYVDTNSCVASIQGKLLSDNVGNVYVTAQACAFGLAPGAVILKITPTDRVRVVEYTANTATTSASYTLYSIDAHNVIYASEANQILNTEPPVPEFVTKIFSRTSAGQRTTLAHRRNLGITSMVPVYEGFVGSAIYALVGAGVVEIGPSYHDILFQVLLP